MPRADNRAVERNDTITDLFGSILGEDSRLVSWNRRVEDIRVDGVRLGDTRAAVTRSGQPRVTEAYHSVHMAADALVSLGYDGATAKIIRRDEAKPPDLKFVLEPGRRTVYVEFSRICHGPDEQIGSLTNEVDERLKRLGDEDQAFGTVVKGRSLHVTFRLRPACLPGADDLVREIKAFALAHDHNAPTFSTREEFGPTYPGLRSFGATYWWSSRGWIGGNVVQYDVPALCLPTLIAAIQDRIDKKDAKGYQQRPLWLLLPVSESWRGTVAGFFDGLNDGSIALDPKQFDAVIVAVTGRAAVIPPTTII